jgi:hypothetical protein
MIAQDAMSPTRPIDAAFPLQPLKAFRQFEQLQPHRAVEEWRKAGRDNLKKNNLLKSKLPAEQTFIMLQNNNSA